MAGSCIFLATSLLFWNIRRPSPPAYQLPEIPCMQEYTSATGNVSRALSAFMVCRMEHQLGRPPCLSCLSQPSPCVQPTAEHACIYCWGQCPPTSERPALKLSYSPHQGAAKVQWSQRLEERQTAILTQNHHKTKIKIPGAHSAWVVTFFCQRVASQLHDQRKHRCNHQPRQHP